MKNSKMKKVTGAVLAGLLVVSAGGIFIAQTSSSFKFVAQTNSQVSAAEFTAKIYQENDAANAIVLDEKTVGDPATLEFDLAAEDIDFSVYDETVASNSFTVENTGEVAQLVTLSELILPKDPNASNDVALKERLSVQLVDDQFNQVTSAVLINPGESKTFKVTAVATPKQDQPGKQGADNAAIGGNAIVGVDILIVPAS